MYSHTTQECVARWIKEFEWRCTEQQIPFTDDAELFLEPDAESDSCRYYVVDYPNRVVFWLEEVATDVLDLPATVTDTHLRFVLEEHYWTHVEYFSMHRCREVNLSLDTLKTVLLHARVDQLTSVASTFPYGATDCSGFLDVVKTAQGLQACFRSEVRSHYVQSAYQTVTSWRRSLVCGPPLVSTRLVSSFYSASSCTLQCATDSQFITASSMPACRETNQSWIVTRLVHRGSSA